MTAKLISHDNLLKTMKTTHGIYKKFCRFLELKYGADLFGEERREKVGKRVIKWRPFNKYELSKRLVGYDVICAIQKYVEKNKDIKVVPCDDEVYSSSIIVLIPHPQHGITMLFIPQCTYIQNEFFLYDGHYKLLVSALKEMSWVYDKSKTD